MGIKKILAWSVLTCLVVLMVVFYVQAEMRLRQLEREIIYRKAQALAVQQRREQMLHYQKQFETQRLRQRYNQGRVVGVKTSSAR